MTQCQFTDEIKMNIKSRLDEIGQRVDKIISVIDNKEGCILCEITSIIESAFELEKLVSFYHFNSSLVQGIEGMDHIVKALAALSQKKHGALIAIEKNESLDGFIKACMTTGVPIEADVSAPLLQAIFYPGNPLHDGAVIIKNNRIAAAGCVLPISERKYNNEGKKIGTRHRAAIGLSERADALVLVVSEETGDVSFAVDGVLHPFEVKLCTENRLEPAGVEV